MNTKHRAKPKKSHKEMHDRKPLKPKDGGVSKAERNVVLPVQMLVAS